MLNPHIGHSRAAATAALALGLSSGRRPTPGPRSNLFPIPAQRPLLPIPALPPIPQPEAREPSSPQVRFRALAMRALRAEQNPFKTGLSLAV